MHTFIANHCHSYGINFWLVCLVGGWYCYHWLCAWMWTHSMPTFGICKSAQTSERVGVGRHLCAEGLVWLKRRRFTSRLLQPARRAARKMADNGKYLSPSAGCECGRWLALHCFFQYYRGTNMQTQKQIYSFYLLLLLLLLSVLFRQNIET